MHSTDSTLPIDDPARPRGVMTSGHASPDGLFDDHAMIRRVHRERAVALHGQRALLMQAAHPLAFVGFWGATAAQEPEKAYPRLARTAEAMATAVFGSATDAEAMGRRVRSIHGAISGTLAEDVGPWTAGTRWNADDPELLLWILASLVDSARVTFDRFVRPLRPEERDAFWRDYRVVGELFGLRQSDMPQTIAAFDAYIADMLASDRTEVIPSARAAGRQIVLRPPVPVKFRPVLKVANEITASMLPGKVRKGFGLRWDPARDLGVDVLGVWSRLVLQPLLPTTVAWTPHGSPAPITG
ncbi:oxygenase MpaB family protein [Patulibacter minatonensis]|uniref:oxygenase MpaB family protein n=1 Tax=Patulibacter minatonensis TaxID=298163 RepID=UPI0004BCEFD7|nr:oxygenase MpaB family protein [Patulibacter minatonensis]